MSRRRSATVLGVSRVRIVLVALVLPALALALVACGGGKDVVVTRTVEPSTSSPPTTSTPSTASTPVTTAPATATGTTTSSVSLAQRLPAEDAIPGLKAGSVRDLPTATDLVDALYESGDATKPQAEQRFRDEGYQDGVLRDQAGEEPSTGIALFRAYVVRLGSAAEAASEVRSSVNEVKRTTTGTTAPVAVPGVPGALGLEVRVTQGRAAKVIFVTFSGGPYLYGYQAIALAASDLPQQAILDSARQTYDRFAAVP
jgi:hypothetical protein